MLRAAPKTSIEKSQWIIIVLTAERLMNEQNAFCLFAFFSEIHRSDSYETSSKTFCTGEIK